MNRPSMCDLLNSDKCTPHVTTIEVINTSVTPENSLVLISSQFACP